MLTLPLADYVRDPAPTPSLSASLAHLLLTRSAQHAWLAHPKLNPAWKPAAAEAMDIGTIAHALVLENDASRIVVIDAADWRTTAAKAARDEARAAGKLPVLTARRDSIFEMVTRARAAIAESELAAAFADGQPEQTLVWQDDGVWCRCRPDWLTTDRRVAIDYKTTAGSAEPKAWARGPLLAMGYDLQAAFGLRGIQAVCQPRDCAFVFMVQEIEPPYAVSFVGLAPAFVAFAEQKRAAAVRLWAACLQDNRWPGYPLRVAWAEPPKWAESQWSEQNALDWPTPQSVEGGVEAL